MQRITWSASALQRRRPAGISVVPRRVRIPSLRGPPFRRHPAGLAGDRGTKPTDVAPVEIAHPSCSSRAGSGTLWSPPVAAEADAAKGGPQDSPPDGLQEARASNGARCAWRGKSEDQPRRNGGRRDRGAGAAIPADAKDHGRSRTRRRPSPIIAALQVQLAGPKAEQQRASMPSRVA